MAKKNKQVVRISEMSEFEHNQTPVEKAADILKRELPRLINDVTMLVRRPFRIIWDSSIATASTDCLAEIRVAPRPFIEGEKEFGYGTTYHETGHINYSPYGMELMAEAHHDGGEVLQALVNILLDRKDDMLTSLQAPGFADTLRRRLLVLRTLSRRERYKHILGSMKLSEQSLILRNFKPTDAYEDFFLAAKCGKSPRTKAGKKAMKYVRLKDLIGASPDKLLWIAKKVRETLGEHKKLEEDDGTSHNQSDDNSLESENDSKEGRQKEQSEKSISKVEVGFLKLWRESEIAGNKEKPDKEMINALKRTIRTYLRGLRNSRMTELVKKLSSMGIVYPGPISVGIESKVPLKRVESDPRYALSYQNIFREIQDLVNPMVLALRNVSTPSEFEIYGRDEGELDLTEVARIAASLGGYFTETVIERDIDAEFHLAVDCSGSMAGIKMARAKKIAVAFSEAIQALDPLCFGRLWSFNSELITDYGSPNRQSGLVALRGTGGNSDTHMLKVVGTELLKSTKRRKILIVLCDDGPDDMEIARNLSQQLSAKGVIVIHLLIGVHGTPDIYPIELMYTSMKECLEEFGSLLLTIISHLK